MSKTVLYNQDIQPELAYPYILEGKLNRALTAKRIVVKDTNGNDVVYVPKPRLNRIVDIQSNNNSLIYPEYGSYLSRYTIANGTLIYWQNGKPFITKDGVKTDISSIGDYSAGIRFTISGSQYNDGTYIWRDGVNYNLNGEAVTLTNEVFEGWVSFFPVIGSSANVTDFEYDFGNNFDLEAVNGTMYYLDGDTKEIVPFEVDLSGATSEIALTDEDIATGIDEVDVNLDTDVELDDPGDIMQGYDQDTGKWRLEATDVGLKIGEKERGKICNLVEFTTTELGIFGVLIERKINFPYKSWNIRCINIFLTSLKIKKLMRERLYIKNRISRKKSLITRRRLIMIRCLTV